MKYINLNIGIVGITSPVLRSHQEILWEILYVQHFINFNVQKNESLKAYIALL